MTREKHDQFAKELLRTVLEPLGTTTAGIEIPGEPLEVDVAFEATHDLTPEERELYGLPGRLIAPVALFEPYRHSLEVEHVWNGAAKLSWTWLAARRKVESSRDLASIPLWIVSPSAPAALLADHGLKPAYEVHGQGLHADWWTQNSWPEGVYLLGSRLPLGVIVLNQLPEVRETLTLRLLARGKTLRRAIDEVRQLSPEDPLRTPVLHLLLKWRIIEVEVPALEPEEQEVSMYAQMTYQEWANAMRRQALEEGIEKGIEKGLEQGIEKGIEKGKLNALRQVLKRLWLRRFGPVPASVQDLLMATVNSQALEAAVDVLTEARTGTEAEADLLKQLQAP